ncbi:MAG: double-strand break repair protein AddB [Rhodospirillales bacterium]
MTVYTIPPGAPFVDALADGLMARAGGDALALPRMTVLLPTRRAGRALREAFLRLTDGRALLLPRMVPIGDVDEDELAFEDEAAGADALEVPPAIPALRRQLMLTRLILASGALVGDDAAERPAQAGRLAVELAALLDQVQTERVDFAALAGLVPAQYAEHWQRSLTFLRILTDNWPAVLAEDGSLDSADRRNRLIAARCAAWARTPPAGPVIAAGSTGSIPATADLLTLVARLPGGAVVLPGLDRDLDPAARAELAPTHPQYGMAQLLAAMEVAAVDVGDWPSRDLRASPPSRATLVNLALHPTGDRPPADPGFAVDAALAGVRRIDCPGPQEEAAVIALLMREALETPQRTAALVTPDRALARRVAAELSRWGIAVDDSAGEPLALSPPGAFLRLAARAVADDWAPVPLLALLKHPLAAGGLFPGAFRSLVRALERDALRGPRPAPGLGGAKDALGREAPWLDALARAAAPFAAALAARRRPLADLLAAHIAFAEALAATGDQAGADRLWAGEAGEALARFVNELNQEGAALEAIDGAAYPALFETLLAGRVARPAYGRHPRLFIWGSLEARLQHADLLILGGLNEGTWPRQPPADPWLSRDMRRRFGLPPPDRRVGLAAHDFVQAFCAPEVVLTRATREEGTPTVPSRWLRRLDALLDGPDVPAHRGLPRAVEARWLHWQDALDRPDRFAPCPPPRPAPPPAARPRQLSVTEIETWMRDPYAIYARRILRLRPLDPIDADPGAAERGVMVHAALERFLKAYPVALPADPYKALVEIGRDAFGDALDRPGVWAFWWPRFLRIAEWVAATEAARRPQLATIHGEVWGRLVVAAPAGPFTLIAKADRVDGLKDGRLAIIDYKTGATPDKKTVAAGLAPQLPLEAAMAVAGGFDGVPAAAVAELAFWRLAGGAVSGEEKPAGDDPAALAADAAAGLARLVAAFDDPATPYLATPDPARPAGYGDYDHLARVREWSAGDGS